MLRDIRRVPCEDCGRSFAPYLMDFDHRDPETKAFNVLQRAGSVSRRRLTAEIAKCDIVCANCHKARGHARWMEERSRAGRTRGAYRSARVRSDLDLLQRIRDTRCLDCGGRFPYYMMQFDHRDPAMKSFELVHMAGRRTLVALLEELAKCDIVCCNCHRDRTTRRRSSPRE